MASAFFLILLAKPVVNETWPFTTIHLIRGNHEKRSEEYESCFDEVADYQVIGAEVREAYNVGAMWQDYELQTFEEILARQGREISLI